LVFRYFKAVAFEPDFYKSEDSDFGFILYVQGNTPRFLSFQKNNRPSFNRNNHLYPFFLANKLLLSMFVTLFTDDLTDHPQTPVSLFSCSVDYLLLLLFAANNHTKFQYRSIGGIVEISEP